MCAMLVRIPNQLKKACPGGSCRCCRLTQQFQNKKKIGSKGTFKLVSFPPIEVFRSHTQTLHKLNRSACPGQLNWSN